MKAVRDEHRTGSVVGVTSDAPPLSIVHTVSSLSIGGMEQVVLRLAVAQKEMGHRVGILAIRGGPLEVPLLSHGIHAEVLGSGRIRRGLEALSYFRAQRPDVVHAHNPTSLHYAVLAKLVSRAVVIVTVHGEINARRGSQLEWYLASAVAMVSETTLQNLRLPCSVAKIRVVHNGIAPIAENRPLRRRVREKLGVTEVVVGAIVARLSGLKGHATLLTSVRILREAGLHIQLLIVGEGDRRAELERQAQDLSLEGTVRFLGARSDVDDLLRAADFFVLPSDSEGLPLSVLEAMAHGLPIVASRVGGIPELIENNVQGLLIPPGDPVSLAAAIRSICDDPSLRRRLGDAARFRATTEFSVSTTMRNYDRLYREALAG